MPRVRVLGPVEPPVDGARARAVLAVLAHHAGRVVPRAELIDLVWGERPPRTVVNQLQIAVHRLRLALGPGAVRTVHGGYLLAAETDLAEFRAGVSTGEAAARRGDWPAARASFHAATALWREGAEPPASLVETLEEERVRALTSRMVADLVAGERDGVLATTETLLAARPLDERLLHLRALASGDLAAYQRAMSALSEATGLDPGRDLRALGADLASGDLTGAVERVKAWVTGVPAGLRPRPMELPAGIGDFVGRAVELERVTSALRAGGAVSVVGLGGVGKTALAVRAARSALTAFPDGCLFTDLRGADEEPRDPHAVLGSFLRSLGVPGDAIPAERAERARLYRDLVARRRLLVVLDNAFDDAQIADLLPATAAIVTSRNALSTRTAVPLGMLAEEEAADLIGRLTDATDAERRALMAFTGRLPLALRIVAARMSRRARGRVLARLADEGERLDELADGDRQVRSCIAIGHRRLTEEARTLLRAVAWLPVSEFSLGVAMGLTGLGLTATEEIAGELEDAQLLTRTADEEGAARWLAIHDLVRLYVREEAAGREEERREVLTRGLRTLHAAAVAASDAMRQWDYHPLPAEVEPDPDITRTTLADPVAWFGAHRELLTEGVRVAAAFGRAELAWGLIGATEQYRRRVVATSERRAVVDAAMPSLPRLRGVHLAAAQEILGMLDMAEDHFMSALRMIRLARIGFHRGGDRLRAAAAAVALAMRERGTGHLRTAHAAAEWALARLDGEDRRTCGMRAWARHDFADILFDDEIERGREMALAAIADARASGDRNCEASALALLGIAEIKSGNLGRAVELLTESVDRLHAAGHVANWLAARRILAEALRTNGSHERASAQLESLIADGAELGSVTTVARAKRMLAAIHVDTGEFESALALAEEALVETSSVSSPLFSVMCLRTIARAALTLGDTSRVRRAHAEAAALLPQDHPYMARMRHFLAEAEALDPA